MAIGQVNANDPRVKRTRKLLEQALMGLMQEKSFETITVQDLAERATLNRATFYAHFEDKYDLLDSIMREGVQQVLSGAVPATTPLNAATLLVLCRAVFEFVAQLHDHCRPRDRQFDPLLERAVQGVLQGFVAGRLRQEPGVGPAGDTSVETAAAVIGWAIFGTASQWSRGPRVQSVEVVAAQVVAVLTDGLPGLAAAPSRGALSVS